MTARSWVLIPTGVRLFFFSIPSACILNLSSTWCNPTDFYWLSHADWGESSLICTDQDKSFIFFTGMTSPQSLWLFSPCCCSSSPSTGWPRTGWTSWRGHLPYRCWSTSGWSRSPAYWWVGFRQGPLVPYKRTISVTTFLNFLYYKFCSYWIKQTSQCQQLFLLSHKLLLQQSTLQPKAGASASSNLLT